LGTVTSSLSGGREKLRQSLTGLLSEDGAGKMVSASTRRTPVDRLDELNREIS
jgi:hypothetical protein